MEIMTNKVGIDQLFANCLRFFKPKPGNQLDNENKRQLNQIYAKITGDYLTL